MQSSMFLGDTTNIDHAYIDENGVVVGGSYRPKFFVTGDIDPVENVVVDFSTIKKTLKAIIDDKVSGYDHKLWWINGVSEGEISFVEDQVHIITPYVNITGPKDIVKLIDGDVDEYFVKELTVLLNQKYPNVNITIENTMTTTFDLMPHVNSDAFRFRYVHGLKESTSWGCQNIAHGHLSYIAAETTNELATNMLLAGIASTLDGSVFVWHDNITGHDQDGSMVTVEYTSGRGHMKMEVHDSLVVPIETETTVEHLVEFVAAEYGEMLRNAGVTRLHVSEGLSKGACVTL